MASKKKSTPKGNPKGHQVQVMGYYPKELAVQLDRLSRLTMIPKAALLREALTGLLERPEYAEKLAKGNRS